MAKWGEGGRDIDVIVQKEQKQSVVACRGVGFFLSSFSLKFLILTHQLPSIY